MSSYAEEREVALAAVLEASRLCHSVQSSLVSDESMAKKDKSPVTVADYGAQAIVAARLLERFPDIPMVGEEDAAALRDPENSGLKDKVVSHVRGLVPELSEARILDLIDSGTHEGGSRGRHWCLDPIDGTKGFLRLDQYAVALALIENGEVVLGVLGCPNLPVAGVSGTGARGCLFAAVRGLGATMRTLDDPTERPISVSQIDRLADASFCESVESGHSSHGDSAKVAELLGVTADPVRIDSQCKYGAVSRGDAAIYLRLPTRADYQEKIWDHAAGAIVVEEAGGQVSDAQGNPLDFSLGRTLANNKGVIVTNGTFHAEVIAAVKQVLGL